MALIGPPDCFLDLKNLSLKNLDKLFKVLYVYKRICTWKRVVFGWLVF